MQVRALLVGRWSVVRYVSLFSGIEAASVAWEPLGWDAVAFAEIEPFPSAVLAERFPDVPNLGDVTKVDWSQFAGAVDVVVGGSPCQAFSVAGERRGLMDERGQLMFEFVRACAEIRPRYVLWENVSGVLSQDKGRAFGTFLGELEDIGLSCAWRVLDAQFFGVAQRRQRVFLVGCAAVGRAAAVLFEREGMPWHPAPSQQKRQELAEAAGGRAGGAGERICVGFQTDHLSQNGAIWSADIAKTLDTQQPSAVCVASGQANAETTLDGSTPTLTTLHEAPILAYSMVERCGKPGGGKGPLLQEDVSSTIRAEGMQQTIFQPYGADVRNGRLTENLSGTLQTRSESLNFTNPALVPKGSDYVIRRLTPLECERLQGFPDDWTRIPWKGKPTEECPDTLRYRCCGNSMAVPVMRWLGERIQMVDQIP